MIEIERIRSYYLADTVFASRHAKDRFLKRGIRDKDVRAAVFSGKIIEQYPDDYPFPSCLILGTAQDGRLLHVVLSDEDGSSRIITAYYPDPECWQSDFETRKEK